MFLEPREPSFVLMFMETTWISARFYLSENVSALLQAGDQLTLSHLLQEPTITKDGIFLSFN
jgi:hypothetical protein